MNDPYLSQSKCIYRLFDDYQAHKSLLVAFDFDDTIFDFHNKGYEYPALVDILKQCQELGFTLILFTGNEGEKLYDCIEYCNFLGLTIKYANESPIMKENRKPFYNIFLDDRAGLGDAYYILTETIKLIKKEKRNENSTISI